MLVEHSFTEIPQAGEPLRAPRMALAEANDLTQGLRGWRSLYLIQLDGQRSQIDHV